MTVRRLCPPSSRLALRHSLRCASLSRASSRVLSRALVYTKIPSSSNAVCVCVCVCILGLEQHHVLSVGVPAGSPTTYKFKEGGHHPALPMYIQASLRKSVLSHVPGKQHNITIVGIDCLPAIALAPNTTDAPHTATTHYYILLISAQPSCLRQLCIPLRLLAQLCSVLSSSSSRRSCALACSPSRAERHPWGTRTAIRAARMPMHTHSSRRTRTRRGNLVAAPNANSSNSSSNSSSRRPH
jgi:hypothetical protein